jgi:hypothetical protein
MARRVIEQFPHCDSRVLHAPGECEFCDRHPDWQELRVVWGINFTGHYVPNRQPCPAEQARPLNVINRWPGNVPETPERKEERRQEMRELKQTLERIEAESNKGA